VEGKIARALDRQPLYAKWWIFPLRKRFRRLLREPVQRIDPIRRGSCRAFRYASELDIRLNASPHRIRIKAVTPVFSKQNRPSYFGRLVSF
jgi:hypothetical protein